LEIYQEHSSLVTTYNCIHFPKFPSEKQEVPYKF
jgi:hypothetical protein